ncbi:MAG: hypothetical protein HY775_02060 [Acidobacteria bacterium]|nr:hypothetical protein [Acidobacteriota bacterium]
MVIPAYDRQGNLPPGIHDATWDELSKRYGSTARRRELLKDLRRALVVLRAAGCNTVYVDGSFVTRTEMPRDFDACWDDTDVDLAKVDPVLLDFSGKRASQKAKYLGELFPSNAPADAAGRVFLDFFQTDRDTGGAKGIVRLGLRRLG